MRIKRKSVTLGAAGLLVAALAAAPSLANADVASTTASKPAQHHCVLYFDSGERCYDTFEAATNDAAASERAKPAQGTVRAQASVDLSGWVTGGRVFTGPNFTGDTLTLMVPKLCKKNGKYDRVYDLAKTKLFRNIESVQAWGKCWVWLHDGPNAGGARQGPFEKDTASLGDWSNRAASIGLS